MLLTAVPLMLIMVPGELVWVDESETSTWQDSLQDLWETTSNLGPRIPDFFFLDVDLYEHGWPFPYMARGVIREGVPSQHGFFTDSYKGIGWIYAETWPFLADKRVFRWWALAADLSVGLIILGIVGAAIEWRIRSGAGRWRLRLLDAFMITAVLALFLAPFAYHAHVQRLEATVLSLSFEENGTEVSYGYHGPVWLRKLVGNKFFLRSMFHIDAITINPSDNWQEEFAQLEKCPFLTAINSEKWLPLGAIPILQRNPNISQLTLPDIPLADALRKEQGDPHEPFQVQHIARLEPLGLTAISMSGYGYQARHARQIAEFSTIQSIHLFKTQVTYDELKSLQRDFPHVTFIFTSSNNSTKPTL